MSAHFNPFPLESVIISVLSQELDLAAPAAPECSQIFDSGRKYPGKFKFYTENVYFELILREICYFDSKLDLLLEFNKN